MFSCPNVPVCTERWNTFAFSCVPSFPPSDWNDRAGGVLNAIWPSGREGAGTAGCLSVPVLIELDGWARVFSRGTQWLFGWGRPAGTTTPPAEAVLFVLSGWVDWVKLIVRLYPAFVLDVSAGVDGFAVGGFPVCEERRLEVRVFGVMLLTTFGGKWIGVVPVGLLGKTWRFAGGSVRDRGCPLDGGIDPRSWAKLSCEEYPSVVLFCGWVECEKGLWLIGVWFSDG